MARAKRVQGGKVHLPLIHAPTLELGGIRTLALSMSKPD